jgi:phosphopantothenate---cysteine ligase (CTP)
MRIIVTCGPGLEPLDQVRFLTNLSTGHLGTVLSNFFHEKGHQVYCLRGSNSSSADPVGVEIQRFIRNNDLLEILEHFTEKDSVDVILHTAALADFQVKKVTVDQKETTQRKIPSNAGELTVTLEPAPKVIQQLRKLFPKARIVGWKYELDGDKAAAQRKAQEQVKTANIDLSVINGAAYGPGFGICTAEKQLAHADDPYALAFWLDEWLKKK